MNRKQRLYLYALALGWKVAKGVENALVANLEESRGSSNGESEEALAPLYGWSEDKLDFTCGPADRNQDSTPLVDSGALVDSIQLKPAGFSVLDGTRDGRKGFRLRIEIYAKDYGADQARGGVFPDVYLGRTAEIRRARNWGDLEEGCDFIHRSSINVVPRPWWQISRSRLRQIATAAGAAE